MKKRGTILAMILAFATLQLMAQELKVDMENSGIEWLGKKITGEHNGTIEFKDVYLNMDGNMLNKGSFVVDMTSIKNLDIEDKTYNDKLVGHLKSDDFFGVESYPTAKFETTSVSEFKNGTAKVNGKLTIKGITKDISFDAYKQAKMLTAKLEIDRSLFNIRYGSNSFFDNLGDKAIEDIFTLDIKLALK